MDMVGLVLCAARKRIHFGRNLRRLKREGKRN